MNKLVSDIAGIPPQERLRLIELLWNSLDDSDVPLTKAQRIELDERLASFEQDRTHGVSWDLLKSELRKRG